MHFEDDGERKSTFWRMPENTNVYIGKEGADPLKQFDYWHSTLDTTGEDI